MFDRQRNSLKAISWRGASFLIALGVLWIGSVMIGFWCLWLYEWTPGVSSQPPFRWPKRTRLPLDRKYPTLVAFIHPHCPCSRATLSELKRALPPRVTGVRTHVVFRTPEEPSSNWTDTTNVRHARELPGASIWMDEAGHETKLFRATVSGHVVLYRPSGRRVFSGGITGSRGHEGANAGRTALMEWICDQASQVRETPVYGCPLFSN
ncbi:MAG: hypothetical protein ACFCD0_16385 [Gemmataceae bacterium]